MNTFERIASGFAIAAIGTLAAGAAVAQHHGGHGGSAHGGGGASRGSAGASQHSFASRPAGALASRPAGSFARSAPAARPFAARPIAGVRPGFSGAPGRTYPGPGPAYYPHPTYPAVASHHGRPGFAGARPTPGRIYPHGSYAGHRIGSPYRYAPPLLAGYAYAPSYWDYPYYDYPYTDYYYDPTLSAQAPLYVEPQPVDPAPVYAPPPPPAPAQYDVPPLAQVAPPAPAPQPAPSRPAPRFDRVTLSARELFAFDKSELRMPQPKLDEISFVMRENPELTGIHISGYTDRLGSSSYNRRLSQKRADAVKEYLVSRGIDAKRLIATGRGESDPIVNCPDMKRDELIRCLEPNRRVEVEQFTVDRSQ